jgi:hypothetical protein
MKEIIYKNTEITVEQISKIFTEEKASNLRRPSLDHPKVRKLIKSFNKYPAGAAALAGGIKLYVKDIHKITRENVIQSADGGLRLWTLAHYKEWSENPEQTKSLSIGCTLIQGEVDPSFIAASNDHRKVTGLQKSGSLGRMELLNRYLTDLCELAPIDYKSSLTARQLRDSYILRVLSSFIDDRPFANKSVKVRAQTIDWNRRLIGLSKEHFGNMCNLIRVFNERISDLPLEKGTLYALAATDYQLKINAGILSCLMYIAGKSFFDQKERTINMKAIDMFNSEEVQRGIKQLRVILDNEGGDVNSTCIKFGNIINSGFFK